MKVFVGSTSDFIETKADGKGGVDISIRTSSSDKKITLITAKLNDDSLGKLISNLILLKSKISNEQK